ncbi:hypothetical protein CL6EHI_020990 [Entamoeba histolytica]|uniref:Uncharacterized protein n=4 Tax=Entamoeba histolytica TaxID=5759 RepID=B1N477_ENTH1|nr:hypothetical protein EHI_020990 [Entamoeba histolytica HM-1:IMSS]EDS89239.1 hypothetical protein EHI_020990 [Entamoeba histolytica HM-1:IMSS]EMD45823.1 Hypothetical protein EHI5A_198280 [Entamoeba histolytica KU27]GAT97769.1 hypothetical protein CL6EHI_020990 [Entamoeba histolytica]|eukprot:XP_001913993.1 hypothetical protein EHI_020990 [Entamoeba histolytica HM-1:IMSS]
MYGTPNRCTRDVSEEETEIVDRPISLKDVVQLINDISVVAENCNILARGSELSLGEYPLISMKLILEGHIKSIDEIDESIKIFKKNNVLLINKIKESIRRENREKRIDEAEKKKKEEETKPERRKTRPL